jgi:RNA polymerase sigma factor (sigma-70 family)
MADALSLPQRTHVVGPIGLLGDRRLASSAARGDQRAFAMIFERYHQQLYRYCRSIVGNDEDARDALQNTMARMLQALPGERRQIALKPWLYRIAHNESIELLRRRRPTEALEEAHGLATPGVEQQSADRERLRQLNSDLAELPERQRGALLMRELSGLSYDEIGETLAATPAVAKQAVYEARVALQEQAEGREMDCEAVRRSISARDGRMLRGRRVRAHLRTCSGCSDFREGINARSADLASLAPALPAAAAAGMLQSLLGGGGASGSGGGGLLGLLGGGTGKTVAGSAVMKLAVVGAAATVGVGGGALWATHGIGGSGNDPVPVRNASPAEQGRPSPAARMDGSTQNASRPHGKQAGSSSAVARRVSHGHGGVRQAPPTSSGQSEGHGNAPTSPGPPSSLPAASSFGQGTATAANPSPASPPAPPASATSHPTPTSHPGPASHPGPTTPPVDVPTPPVNVPAPPATAHIPPVHGPPPHGGG